MSAQICGTVDMKLCEIDARMTRYILTLVSQQISIKSGGQTYLK